MDFANSNLRKAERYCKRHSQHCPLYIYYNPDTKEYEVQQSRYGAMPWHYLHSHWYMGGCISRSYDERIPANQ